MRRPSAPIRASPISLSSRRQILLEKVEILLALGLFCARLLSRE
jgi:hypothetical protein